MSKTTNKTKSKNAGIVPNPVKPKTKKPRGKGVPFAKKDPITGAIDPRINTTGQNRKFWAVRDMVNKILDETIKENVNIRLGKETISREIAMSRLESMLREWAESKDYQKQSKLLEYGVGKVPDELHINNNEIEEFIKANLDLFTDGQIERLRAGEGGLVIISEIMREYRDKQKENT